jgi:hypothetical protein
MRLELIYDQAIELMDVPENGGFEPIQLWALLSKLKAEKGISFVIRDGGMSADALAAAYDSAVTASASNRYAIRIVFGTNARSAIYFGAGVPALLVYEGERPVDVYPHHDADGNAVTIAGYLEELLYGQAGRESLLREMDDMRREIGPVGTNTAELVQDGRRL